jgi:hypothetical protein
MRVLVALVFVIGCSSNPNKSHCGNGKVDPGETCDPSSTTIPCVDSCNDGNACTVDTLTGSGATCDSVCSFTPITTCVSGDGCCPAGCNHAEDSDCSSACGDGIVETGETCDGNCPTSCNDGNACTTDTLTGSAESCSSSCSFTKITACQSGDGCCPAGCTHAMDSDCSATCGNGTIEPGETCDGNCPTSCNDGNACTTDTLTGAAASCSAACAFQPVTTCKGGDGCCPAGCTVGNDSDCSAFCGDKIVERGESCDGNCPVTCNDANACTVDTLTGSAANCTASCAHTVITTCTSGDGCCPAGCTHNNDSDCSNTCGNNVVETPETCDGNCPTSCDDSNACTVDTLIGSAASCSTACLHQNITECKSGDGCCPSGCTHATDTDCNGTVPVGGACTQGADCLSGACFTEAILGVTGGYCTAGCAVSPAPTTVACPGGSHCGAADPTSGSGFCMQDCSGSCSRSGYQCFNADGDAGNVQECFSVGSGGGAVGDPCAKDADCGGGQLGFCETPFLGFKEGYCEMGCDNSGHPCPGGSTCVSLTSGGTCLKTCTDDTSCRGNGYTCFNASGNNVCTNTANGAGQVGDPCTGLWDCAGGEFGECVLFNGGYCVLACDTGQATCAAGTTCINEANIGAPVCMKDCSPSVLCRAAYQCLTPSGASAMVCTQ